MRKRLASLLFAGAAAAAAVTIAAPSAFASGGVWTVSPSPDSYSASLNSGTTTVLKNNSNNLTLTCTSSKATGTLSTPASGSVLGSIGSISWSSCSGLGGIVSSGSASGDNLPWTLTGTGYNASLDGGQTLGTLTTSAGNSTIGFGVGATIHLTILGSACTTVVGGKTSSTAASATGIYDNTPGLLATTGTSNLFVISSNCSGLSVGNSVTFFTNPTSTAGTAVTHGYAVTPKPTITDP